MKNLFILFCIITITTSCQKEELPIVTTTVSENTNTLDCNLYFKTNYQNSVYLIQNLKPYKINNLVTSANNYEEQQVGYTLYFINEDSSIHLTFYYYFDGGVKRVSGSINGHTFISTENCNNTNALINICYSTQNLPIEYNLFYTELSNL